MKILISGSTGLIGSKLADLLRSEGHEVVPLVRKRCPGSIWWNPETGEFDKEQLEGFDAVIHLAGENIAARRWTPAQKEKLFLSRSRATWLLAQILTRLKTPPKTLITASACGFYGNRGDECLTEASAKGEGFLADLCSKWEGATEAAEKQGIRVVHARFGMILSAEGGALKKMLLPFRLGLGGRLGNGEQFVSWVTLDDATSALYYALVKQDVSGAINFSAPTPIRQKEFAKTLAKKLNRPAFFTIPAPVLRLLLGEMADELLLSSQNVYPERLLASGYTFKHPTLDSALASLL